MSDLKEIARQIALCTACSLSQSRLKTVPGDGSPSARVMLIGEGPGFHEDRQGLPFVGPAGKFLDELLALAGLRRQDVFITNVVKCRPPNNRDPQPEEIGACAHFLDTQIALIKPKVIVTLGRHSMAKFFPGESISRIHGQARVRNGILCFAMYHPAAALHQPALRKVIESDIQKLPALLEQKVDQPGPDEPTEQAEQLSLF